MSYIMKREMLARVAYARATDTRGARFAVTVGNKRKMTPYDHALSFRDNMLKAVGVALGKVEAVSAWTLARVVEMEPPTEKSGGPHYFALHLEKELTY